MISSKTVLFDWNISIIECAMACCEVLLTLTAFHIISYVAQRNIAINYELQKMQPADRQVARLETLVANFVLVYGHWRLKEALQTCLMPLMLLMIIIISYQNLVYSIDNRTSSQNISIEQASNKLTVNTVYPRFYYIKLFSPIITSITCS